jgi:hypothetical protein
MTQIFVSYRRVDNQHAIDRITCHLEKASYFIFKDVISIKPSQLWPQEIETALRKCEVLVALIGKQWLGHANESGQYRIQQDDDYVRYEVRAVLERGVPIIPVLIDDANVPSSDELPEDIRDLVFRQAVRVRSGQDFDGDISKLIRIIRLLAPRKGKSTAIKLGYFLGKLEVFIRSIERVEHRRAAELVIQKISWLSNHLGLKFDVERQPDGVPGNMQLSTAGLRDDVKAIFEIGYHTGRFYGMTLAFIATGLVQDNTITNSLKEKTVDLLPKACLPEDFLAPVMRHWHIIPERTKVTGTLDPKAINSAEVEADRIIAQLGFQVFD